MVMVSSFLAGLPCEWGGFHGEGMLGLGTRFHRIEFVPCWTYYMVSACYGDSVELFKLLEDGWV